MTLIVDLHGIDGLIRIDAHLATALKALEKLPKHASCRKEAEPEIEAARESIVSLKAWLGTGTEVPQEKREHVRQYHLPGNSRER